MSVDARTEKFEHIELFGKPALFTNERIIRDTVPEGWYCYDFRGSDNDPGKLNCVELRVGVNHSGAVLLPEEIDMKGKEYRRVRGQINFLGEKMTVREFCEAHSLECTIKEHQFHIRPARPDEAGLFYAQHPDEDKRLGCIGHVRMDFGKSGNEFWYTWWPRGPEEWNNPTFKSELQKVVDELRLTVLKNRFTMERFCHAHGGKINGGYVQNYGFIVETEHYRYCLRCNPSPGDYNGYLTAFDKRIQQMNMVADPDIHQNIRDWYMAAFPADELGSKIKDITFSDLVESMNRGENVYETLGVDDSIVRERVFDRIVTTLKVDYDVIYYKWLDGDKAPDIALPEHPSQQSMTPEEKPLIGRVTFVNGDTQEYTDAEDFLKCIQDELPDHPVTGFRYEVLTDDPAVRKAADDILYGLYGEENPRTLEDYETKPEQGMMMGGL